MATRICMWSGPRNLSTTMMRSFGARADTVCSDEPFYAAFLKATGLDHPVADDVIHDGETNPVRVSEILQHKKVDRAAYWYQKHMCHHMLDGFPLDFMNGAKHIFLIRDPRRVVASWIKKNPKLTLAEIAVEQQCKLYEHVSSYYGTPPVVDTDDLLQNPSEYLQQLCSKIGIPWDADMIKWPSGPTEEDGIWGKVWYDGVWASTGFGPPPGTDLPALPAPYADLAEQAMPFYDKMRRAAL